MTLQIPSTDFNVELERGNLKGAMAEAGATNPHALWNVPYSQLRVIDGFNARVRTPEYEAHLEALTQSIIENGYYQDKPLAGYVAKDENGDNVIFLTEGHTRYEAVGRAIERGTPIETLPVVVKPRGTSMVDLTVALATSNEGRPFTPYEKAVVVKRLVGYGLDVPTIGRRLAMTTKYVNDLLTLVEAPKDVQELVAAGKVSPTLAIQELGKHGAKAAERLKAAVAKAEGSGKGKATAKHLEGRQRAVREPKVREITEERLFQIADEFGITDEITFDSANFANFMDALLKEVGATVKWEPVGKPN